MPGKLISQLFTAADVHFTAAGVHFTAAGVHFTAAGVHFTAQQSHEHNHTDTITQDTRRQR